MTLHKCELKGYKDTSPDPESGNVFIGEDPENEIWYNGWAISSCQESENDTLWVGNGEYCNRVNFCPMCGYKAKKQMEFE